MLSVTLIANAGVLIQCGKVRILLDAVEDAGQYPFSSTPGKVLEEMFSQTGERPYRNADFLIFSHGHPDHFSGELAETYLAFNQVRRIVCGPAEDEKARSFLEAAKHKGATGRAIQGDADILLFPDIHAGNLVYKCLVHTAKVVNGNILTGTKAPVILTSRSDDFETKVNSIALGAVVAEAMKNQ